MRSGFEVGRVRLEVSLAARGFHLPFYTTLLFDKIFAISIDFPRNIRVVGTLYSSLILELEKSRINPLGLLCKSYLVQTTLA